MTTVIIIICAILFVAAILLLHTRQLLAPPCAYAGLLALSFAKTANGYPLVPLNGTILTGWLCMTVAVMIATLLQPIPIRDTSRGMGYITMGAIAGMAVGLIAFSVSYRLELLYGIMIVSTMAGIFLGFLLYTNTPEGRPVGIRSGNFFRYLLAKGFPAAITIMQIGVALVLAIALYRMVV